MASTLGERECWWEERLGWPPSEREFGGGAVEVSGEVVAHFPLKVRREGTGKGFHRNRADGDTVHLVTAVVVRTAADVPGTASFGPVLPEEQKGCTVFWAARSVEADLRAKPKAPADPIAPGSAVDIVTRGACPLVARVTVTKYGKQGVEKERAKPSQSSLYNAYEERAEQLKGEEFRAKTPPPQDLDEWSDDD